MDRPPIELLPYTLDVAPVRAALEDPKFWNQHQLRTEQYVHSDVSDIWVRFHEWEEGLTLEQYNRPHVPVWYPIATEIPEIPALVHRVWDWATNLWIDGCVWQFGGVLITKIPPGKRVEPHVDRGWHAEHYNIKHAVQIQGNQDQAFCFEGYEVRADSGQCYMFDNQQEHWVINDSDEDRITMIVCMRCDFWEL